MFWMCLFQFDLLIGGDGIWMCMVLVMSMSRLVWLLMCVQIDIVDRLSVWVRLWMVIVGRFFVLVSVMVWFMMLFVE